MKLKKNENALNVKNEIKLAKEVKKLKDNFNEMVKNKEDEFDKARD